MPSVLPLATVVDIPDVTIREYFGNVATRDATISAAHVTIHKESSEAWQTPKFDEYVIITKGEVHLLHAAGKTIVKQGHGVFLKAGFRVKWVFPAPCEYIPLCLPAFSPDNVCREEENESSEPPSEPATETTSGDIDGLVVTTSVDVVKTPALTISEYFGGVASKDATISACVAVVNAECEEAYQTPDFDEYVIVLEGEVHLQQTEGVTKVAAGNGVLLKKGERVKWTWPGCCKYIPVCLPAFTPTNCHREEEEGTVKDGDAMAKLHALHEKAES